MSPDGSPDAGRVRVPPGAWLGALLLVLATWSFRDAGPVDDDWISARYARNLLAGRGLVYLEGVRAEGFTAPLWTFAQALGLALGLTPARLALLAGLLAAAGIPLALGRAWAARHPGSRLAPPALLVALSPVLAWHGVAGLGTLPLAALLCLWLGAWETASVRGRDPLAAGVWLALACLLRQECALFALPFAIAVGLGKGTSEGSGRFRARRLLAAALPLLALAAWTGFRLLHFGRLLPITYSVKKLPVAQDLIFGLAYLGEATRVLLVVPLLGAAVFAVLTENREQRVSAQGSGARASLAGDSLRLDRALLAGLLLHTAYVVWVGGDFVPWARFLVPTFPLLLHLALRAGRPLGWTRHLLLGLLVLGLVWPWARLAWLPAHVRDGLRGRAWVHDLAEWRALDHDAFERRWARVGRWLAQHVQAGASVATSPVGVIGWEYEGPVLDLLGLTHPHALDVEPDPAVGVKGHHRSATEWVLVQRPEWAVLGNGLLLDGRLEINPWERDLVLDPRFQRDYRQVRVRLPDDPQPLELFVRADVPLPPGCEVRR